MIRAIIVDDEQHCINRLQNLLKEHEPAVSIAGAFQSVEDGLKAIRELEPDVVFLDVEIRDKSAFDLLQQLNEITFTLIFITAYQQYAVQAFKFSALDYLLKPIDPDDLKQAIYKLKEKVSKNEMATKLDALFYNLKNIQGATKKISVPTSTGLSIINVSDILRCESEGNYTNIFLKDKQKILVSKTLKDYEDLLADYNFYRVHNSHLINLSHVKEYNKGKAYISMTDNSFIEVSTRRKDEVFKKLSRM